MEYIKALRDILVQELSIIYPEKESLNIIHWLFESVAGIKKSDFSTDPSRILDDRTVQLLTDKFAELMHHRPIQYVTGVSFFHGLKFEVNESVLIPRPETEELVKWIIDDNKYDSGLKVLDIGTGSGCILLTLGLFLKAPELTGIDISSAALEVATRNARKIGVTAAFQQLDILNEKEWDVPGNYDIIVSNPPYVRDSEKSLMKENVLHFEPAEALFVRDHDPLAFYRAIAMFSKSKLNKKGKLYLEINENLCEETVSVIKTHGFSGIQPMKDLQGKYRMIRCTA
jgi:release factor glutamine methyltransferase